jgi:hypothetical protein
MTPLQKSKVAEQVRSGELLSTSMLAIVLDQFGAEALNWEPETLKMELSDLLGVTPQMDGLNGLITALTTDMFHTDYLVFNRVCEALNGDPVDHDDLDPVTPEMMAWAITEVGIHQDKDHRDEFTEEVKRYIGFLCSYYGLRVPKGVLKFADMPPEDDSSLRSDPQIHAAFLKGQETNNTLVSEYVRVRLLALIDQLGTIPLDNRDKGWDDVSDALMKRFNLT